MKNKKHLGQNWLKDRPTLLQIAELSQNCTKYNSEKTCHNNTVLEIGPGLGTLTSALLKYYDQVIAVEFDETLAKNLPASFPGKNLTVHHADILDFDLTKLPIPYAVAGNIPYYITSPIIPKHLHRTNKPEKITLLLQKEVAERI